MSSLRIGNNWIGQQSTNQIGVIEWRNLECGERIPFIYIPIEQVRDSPSLHKRNASQKWEAFCFCDGLFARYVFGEVVQNCLPSLALQLWLVLFFCVELDRNQNAARLITECDGG